MKRWLVRVSVVLCALTALAPEMVQAVDPESGAATRSSGGTSHGDWG